jgi:diaminohydroxyphosphoribosylaminopyrimidine deaminase/5-amino-6-(5-phosphoribosylamino)uracil reductase
VRQPLRVVLDTDLKLDPHARLLQGQGALVIAAHDAAGRPAGVTVPVERVARAARGLDLVQVLAVLQAREVNELLVECGATLAGAFLRAGLVDELIVYVAPQLLGADAAPLALLESRAGAAALQAFDFHDMRRVGADLRLTLRPRTAH